jgi:hypothetical protein
LDVIVAVAQHRRFSGRVEPIAVNEGMARCWDNLNVFQPRRPQADGHELGRAPHIGRMRWLCANARNTQKLLQFVKEAVLVLFNESAGRSGHVPIIGAKVPTQFR